MQQFDERKKEIPLYFELSSWTIFEPNRPQCVPENLTLIPIQYCRNANTTADDDYGDEVTKKLNFTFWLPLSPGHPVKIFSCWQSPISQLNFGLKANNFV